MRSKKDLLLSAIYRLSIWAKMAHPEGSAFAVAVGVCFFNSLLLFSVGNCVYLLWGIDIYSMLPPSEKQWMVSLFGVGWLVLHYFLLEYCGILKIAEERSKGREIRNIDLKIWIAVLINVLVLLVSSVSYFIKR